MGKTSASGLRQKQLCNHRTSPTRPPTASLCSCYSVECEAMARTSLMRGDGENVADADSEVAAVGSGQARQAAQHALEVGGRVSSSTCEVVKG